ncbi:mis18-binding protein 1 isoform X2 [Pseudoliparis swirei]|uniref:mis18-binding protein 1 isoform X2 n=1 Tax=Pseudoliparis swirei TaxID=2059687 RepID=UPI0024BE798F|nr:mis18-binding protein 1 isoform X2 [Pseudoliparis swirei]
MASYHKVLYHTTPPFESPAKVFAKLKLKVQSKGICADSPLTNDSLCNVRDKHLAAVKSPRKRAESTWMTEELTANQRSGSDHNKAQVWTLSPISSPQKRSPDLISKHVEEMPPVKASGHGRTLRKRSFLESTAVAHPSPRVNRKQIRTESPHIRHSGNSNVISRTPVKVQPVEEDFESSVFLEGCAPLMSSAFMFSPMRTRLQRQCEQQQFNKVTSSTNEVCNGSRRKPSRAFSGDTSTCIESVSHVGGVSADPSQVNRFTHNPVCPTPRDIANKRCNVPVEKCSLMSPSKMFTYMKKRESKTKQPEVHKVSSSTRELFNTSNFHQSVDTSPPSTVHTVGEMEDVAFRGVPERLAPVNRSRVESADGLSDTEPSEDVLAVSPQPVLFEDPLLLNTPKISIPKKQEAVFKRNKWTQSTQFPSESVIYLKRWFLRKNHKGLFVDGIHQEENIPWNSNIVVDRVSNHVVKTVTGKVYILVDKMIMSLDSGLPKWLLKKFVNGFPPNWEALYERSRSQLRGETERKSEGRVVMAKTQSETSSIIGNVKRHRKTAASSVSRPIVSRSGRVIKPPLEYWKGGRVILDAHMNVTIHECYDTSSLVSTRASQKPAPVLLPCSEGRRQCESASDKEASVPLRRVKAPLRKCNSATTEAKKKPSYSPELLCSPEERCGRQTRSSRRRPTSEDTSYVDTVPQKQRIPVESSKQRSKKPPHDITSPSVSIPAPPEPVDDYKTSALSDDGVIGRKKSGKEVRRKGSRRVLNRPPPSYVFPSSDSSQSSEFEKEPEKRSRVTTKHKRSKRTKSSSPRKPLPKLTQSSKNNLNAIGGIAAILQDQDGDKWTEAELMKLQEAASYYPKHVAGYWAKVAGAVGTRSPGECHFQHTSQATCQTPAKRAKNTKKKKLEVPKDPAHQVISARAGTLKRKQQVRQFLEAMPREDVEDGFSSAYMQSKRFEMPSLCQSDFDITVSEIEPLTPKSTCFPEAKTPQCLHITPGMMGSPNRSNNDKYVHQLQKRMKRNQFNVCKLAPPTKSFTPTPSVKRAMRRCGNTENDTFVVWEMFSGDDGGLAESGEEEDFYFSDND